MQIDHRCHPADGGEVAEVAIADRCEIVGAKDFRVSRHAEVGHDDHPAGALQRQQMKVMKLGGKIQNLLRDGR